MVPVSPEYSFVFPGVHVSIEGGKGTSLLASTQEAKVRRAEKISTMDFISNNT